MTTFKTYYDSPIGTLLLTSDGASLTGLYIGTSKHKTEMGDIWIRDDDALPFAETKRQIAAYFAGELTEFTLPLAPRGTVYQQRVWDELTRIPYGVTCSYGELARRIGQPKGSRAVGMANGRNPISIIIPCHRIVGASGKLTGYSGGLTRKESLLKLEQNAHTVVLKADIMKDLYKIRDTI